MKRSIDRSDRTLGALRIAPSVTTTIFFALILSVCVAGGAFGQTGARGAQHTNTLTVGADVPYAAIYIDGRYTGMAPLSVQLPVGRYAITVDARGHNEFHRIVDLRSDLRIDARLSSTASHTVRITASVPSARIYVNGELKGSAPWSFQLPRGRHEVIVRAPGYEPYRSLIDVQSPTRLHAELVARQARITLSLPDGLGGERSGGHNQVRIELNGRPVQPGTLNVAPGMHRVLYSSEALGQRVACRSKSRTRSRPSRSCPGSLRKLSTIQFSLSIP